MKRLIESSHHKATTVYRWSFMLQMVLLISAGQYPDGVCPSHMRCARARMGGCGGGYYQQFFQRLKSCRTYCEVINTRKGSGSETFWVFLPLIRFCKVWFCDLIILPCLDRFLPPPPSSSLRPAIRPHVELCFP